MFRWLTFKRNVLENSLLSGMIDVHSHLLYGVDDGVQTKEEALSVLTFLEEKVGVKKMFLTPHIMSDLRENTSEKLSERFASFLTDYSGGIALRLAGEYMLDNNFHIHLKQGLLMMAGRHVLVETSYLSAPPNMEPLLYEMLLRGYTPVIAHPERYIYMTDKDRYYLKDRGCKFQLNLMSLFGTYGKGASQCAAALVKQGFYDYLGSDIHKQSVYEYALHHLYLGNSQQREIVRLLENNRFLWR